MKYIVNGRFLLHKVTGVERYARELLYELDKIIEYGEVELVVPPETKEVPHYDNILVLHIGKTHNIMWEHYSLPRYVKKRGGLLINLCNVAPILSPGIVCIHDMKIQAKPQFFSKKFVMWYKFIFYFITKRAKEIITVSQFSKHEIMKYYHVEADKIHVVPNAWQHFKNISYGEDVLTSVGVISKQYFFAMSSIEPNKNLNWIVQCAKLLPQYTFCVAGKINSNVFLQENQAEYPDNLKLLGYVKDEDAKVLMKECKAFLFPTFYEGFGIPPLEAISAGCPAVIVSDTPVMHEVYGDSVTYINPHEAGIPEIISINDEKREEILNRFSWERSAKLFKEIIYGYKTL